jgi:hypothetical protein
MVMQYWKSAAPTVGEIHRAVFSREAGGVYARDMERFLAAQGFQVWTVTSDWDELRENLHNGRPVIVAIEGSPFHYVIVAGMDTDEGLIFFNDPASRKLRAMHRTDFEKRWKTTQNWALLALPTKLVTETNFSGDRDSSPSPISKDLEKASSAFRREDYRDSKRYAKSAEKADPLNGTTNQLLATLYLLDDNVEAALKYWNRTGQPAIRNVEVDPPVKLDPVILDRAFAFSSGSTLTRDDLLLTQRRLDATGSFSNYTFDLSPADDNRMDATLRAADASGVQYLTWVRGLPYGTLRPQFTNVKGRGINLESLLRWDPNKRRLNVSLDGPLSEQESTRFFASADARDERWHLQGADFTLRRLDATVGIRSVIGPRTTWTNGVKAGTRRIAYQTAMDYDLVRWPEQRLVVSGGIRSEIARDRSSRFGKIEPSVRIHWFPQARGSDYETSVQVRAGRASAATPVDELFILGLDRDTDLLLRAHSALNDGRKGAGPIGNRFVLVNAQTAKILKDFGLARIAAGPFLDVARMSSTFVDSGVFVGLSVGRTLRVSLSLGRDLRTGHTVGFLN